MLPPHIHKLFDPGGINDEVNQMNPLYTITEYTGFHLLDDANYPILFTKSEDYYDLLADAVLYTQSIMHASLDLYGHRVKFDRKQILYQFLGEAGRRLVLRTLI